MVYRATDWTAFPTASSSANDPQPDPQPEGSSSSSTDIDTNNPTPWANSVVPWDPPNSKLTEDEQLALAIQESELAQAGLPYRVDFSKVKCVGTWSQLPLELKTQILAHNLTVPYVITVNEARSGIVDKELLQYRHVSQAFGCDAEQVFHQSNRIQLWPGEIVPFLFRDRRDPSDKIDSRYYYTPRRNWQILSSFAYPSVRTNHYLTRLDFYPPQTERRQDLGSSFGLLAVSADRNLRQLTSTSEQVCDIWQYLKNIALGAYGFPSVQRIRVFFGAEPKRMQAFWNWKIKVKTGDQYEIILPDEEFWKESLEAALEIPPEPALTVDEPGFELIRRSKVK
jgi:hypothetical protein